MLNVTYVQHMGSDQMVADAARPIEGLIRYLAREKHERTAENAQWEIKQLALQVSDILGELFPISWGALA